MAGFWDVKPVLISPQKGFIVVCSVSMDYKDWTVVNAPSTKWRDAHNHWFCCDKALFRLLSLEKILAVTVDSVCLTLESLSRPGHLLSLH